MSHGDFSPPPITYCPAALDELVALPDEIRQAVKTYLYVAAHLSLLGTRPAFAAVAFVGGARLHYEFSSDQRTLLVSQIASPDFDQALCA